MTTPKKTSNGSTPRGPKTKKPGEAAVPKVTETEVEAYAFIREQLRDLGWNFKNPSRYPDGQVWTQNQCLAHPDIKQGLDTMRPEYMVKLAETKLWVIEAKRDRSKLATALAEAEDDYARPIMKGGKLTVSLISGVAGNDASGYEVRTRILIGDKYVPVTINGSEATGFLDAKHVQQLLDSGKPDIGDLVIDEALFLKAAERINRHLHTGGINKNDRARTMAALLLALLSDTPPGVESDLPVLIEDINTRTRSVLYKHGKKDFHRWVEIVPPTNTENHVKYKAALVRTIQELTNLSIKSAMNSGADILGKFYEVFLKYGNGAKEIGIVLTPRHFTRFAVQALGVGYHDIVFDPACGTGGFLVAAFDHVRKSAKPAQLDRFKRNNLFGIERESAVAALAIVNMIFRGDGKNNIVEANCFTKNLRRATVDGVATARYVRDPPPAGEEAVTRVFMNPPFALKETDEYEYRFVDAALNNMADGGLLFAIVPVSVLTEAGVVAKWRRDTLLAHHTLLAAVGMPQEVFYPVKNQTVAIVVRKGTPHPHEQPVLWARVVDDGFQKSKGKRLPRAAKGETDLDRLAPILSSFIANPKTPVVPIPKFTQAVPIDFSDPVLELVPEEYLDSPAPDVAMLAARLDAQIRQNIAAWVVADLEFAAGGGQTILDAARTDSSVPVGELPAAPTFADVGVAELFDLTAGTFHGLTELDAGSTPVVSCTIMDNGINGVFDVGEDYVYRDALTIAYNGTPLTTRIHPYAFATKDDVAVAIPREPFSPEALVFIQAALNAECWRFSYYRKCFHPKLGRFKVRLPVQKDGKPDVDFMTKMVRANAYWWFMAPRFRDWHPQRPAVMTPAKGEAGKGEAGEPSPENGGG